MGLRFKHRLFASLSALAFCVATPQMVAAQTTADETIAEVETRDDRPRISLGVEFLELGWEQRILGQEPVSTMAPQLDQVAVNQNIDLLVLQGQVEIPFGQGAPIDYIGIAAGYGSGEGSTVMGAFDPVGDNRLLVPGPTGGASGLSLGDAPGFPNTATNIVSQFEVNEAFLELSIPAFSSTYAPGLEPSYVFEVYGGARVSDFATTSSGGLDGYDGRFTYVAGVEFTQTFAGARVQATVPFSRTTRAPQLAVLFGASAEAVNYDVSGEDELLWSVFNGTTTGGGRTELDESAVVMDGSLEAGVRLRIVDMVLEVTAGVERRHVPRIVRNGTDPSSVELEESVGARLGARATIPF